MKLLHLLRGAACAGLVLGGQAMAWTLYDSPASWSAAVVPGSVVSEDFEGYAPGADLKGIDLGPTLPGVSIDTNLDNLLAVASGGMVAFAFPRDENTDEAFYTISFSAPVNAVAFDVAAWDPLAPGPATLELIFADASVDSVQLNKLAGEEDDPFFVGITALENGGLSAVRWREGPAILGGCCEEVALDNLAIAVAVPEPATWGLLCIGLASIGWVRTVKRGGVREGTSIAG